MNIVRFVAPLAFGFSMAQHCPILLENSDSSMSSNPTLFRIVWIFIYLLIGYAWVEVSDMEKADFYFVVLNLLLLGWIYTYGCAHKRHYAIYLMLLTLMWTLSLAFTYSTIAHLLCPLIAWLIYALILNVFVVKNAHSENFSPSMVRHWEGSQSSG